MVIYKSKSILRYFFTFLIVLYPMLSVYGFFNTALTLPDALMIISLVIIIINSLYRKRIAINKIFLPWTIYIIIHLFLTFCFSNVEDVYDFVGSTLRYLLYFFALILGFSEYFDLESAIKIYHIACVAATLFLILQYICLYFFNYNLNGYVEISFLPVTRAELVEYGENVTALFENNGIVRLRSFFGEPAHYAIYVCGYLTISFFRQGKREWKTQILILIGLLLSMSSTGIITGVLICIIYFIFSFRRKKSLPNVFIILVSLIVAIYFIPKTSFFKNFIYRMTETTSAQDRLGIFSSSSINIWHEFGQRMFTILFGYGLGGKKTAIYAAGFGKLLLSYGVVGTIFLLSTIIFIFKKACRWQKILLIVFLFLQIGTEFLFGNSLFCFIPFAMYRFQDKKAGEMQ